MRKRDFIVIVSAFLSFILSVYLWFSGEKEMGQYVSIWVPTILVYGIYGVVFTQIYNARIFMDVT